MKVGYARVFFKEQKSTLKGQKTTLTAEGCSKVFWDWSSGAQADRPGLRDALAYARDGEDTIVVTRFDRLGRSLTDALRIVQELTEREIGLKALDVKLDTSTAAGQLMLKMLLMLVDWEQGLLRERTMEGLERARAAGKRPGPRPKLDAEQQEAVRAAIADGQTISAAARSFGVSRPTVYKALRSQVPQSFTS